MVCLKGDICHAIIDVMRSKYAKIRLGAFLNVAFWVVLLNVLLWPEKVDYAKQGDNRFTIYMDGEEIGVTDDIDNINKIYAMARREIANDSNDMVLTKFPSITCKGEEVNFGKVDSDKVIVSRMKEHLLSNTVSTYMDAYTVKVNGTVVNLKSADDVKQVFQNAIGKYDSKGLFNVALVKDSNRELNVLTAIIESPEMQSKDSTRYIAGCEDIFDINESDLRNSGNSFDSYDLGIKSMSFSESIEIVETYLPEDELSDVDAARKLLTENQETQIIYKVKPGDTLSEISINVGLPLDDIIELNPSLENENSYIYVDQELLITVPEPELSVNWTEQAKIEEAYDLPITYIYNDSWYTNQQVTHQQPSSGYHEAVLSITHVNDEKTGSEVLYEEVFLEAVPKIVEKGTIVPPTYIKPISGGRMTSQFGPRKAPTKGASTNHKGIDWATPIGTSVYASSGGTVAFAGWGSGYGYVVFINHPDGRQTRYGHLSKIKCKTGDHVSQGQVIALSGNTGRSTGPHVHFEILINGSQVNPLNYLY